jgi:uncharacterized protein (TIGR02145 family)
MKALLRNSFLIVIWMGLILIINSCKKEVPTLTTSVATNITEESATCGGTIIDEGSGPILARGVSYRSTSSYPDYSTNSTGDMSFTAELIHLTPATRYYVKAYAENNVGIGYGSEISFSTLGGPPTIITQSPTNLGLHSATLVGIVNVNYIITTVTFEYGPTESYGTTVSFPWSTLDGFGSSILSACVSGLTESTTYHYRIRAAYLQDTIYGNDIGFTTSDKPASDIIFNSDLTYGSVSDTDGNTYKTIIIGTQTWMAENLRTAKYNDGTLIPTYWFNNDAATYKAAYGAMYTWYSIWYKSNGNKNVCPMGWHVPTDNEWSELTSHLGGEEIAGGNLKEFGTTHWISPNAEAKNLSGFTALPGGKIDGVFYDLGEKGYWWSSSGDGTDDPINAWYRVMYSDSGHVSRGITNERVGMNVRCVID